MALLPAFQDDEEVRIEALLAYSVLNGDADPHIDDIARIAASVCGAAMAFVNFVDRERLWNRAAFGAERFGSAPRAQSFCNHTVEKKSFWEIEDTRNEPLASSHPSVLNAPFVRSYAGLPLLSPFGHVLGTICVVDFKPRRLTDDQRASLEACARQIVNLLELRRQNSALLKAQGEVLKAKSNALDLVRIKGDFIAQVSHEIRTPLNVVLGIANVMLEGELNDKQRGYMQNTRRSAQHILRLLSNVLDHSKLDAGKLAIEQKPFALDETLEDIIEPLRLLASQKRLELHYESRCENLALEGDGLRLSQVLVNIIHNAIKFTEKGWIKIEVDMVEQKAGRALLQFQISDSGCGLSAEDCQRVFQAYQQVSASHAIDGSGLGLSIAKKLVEGMNGQIGVSSVLGQGSTFWCMIPFVSLAERITKRPALAPLKKLQGKLLLVEDDSLNAQITQQCLESFGLEAKIAGHAADALKRADEEDFDLVLLDYRLPDMDGKSLSLALRERLPLGTPIIALTGQERARDCCMDDYVQKPFDNPALKALLSRWLSVRVSGEEAAASKEALDKIRAHSPADFVPRLVRGFLQRNPVELQKMQDACLKGDWKALGFLAHAMKSSLASFGIFPLADVCRKMERQMDEGQFNEAWDDIQALKKGLFAWYRHLDSTATPEQKAAS